jgi:hypothetical protein
MHYLAGAIQPLLADAVRAKVPFILEAGGSEYRFSKENTPKQHTSEKILASESGVYWSSYERRMR